MEGKAFPLPSSPLRGYYGHPLRLGRCPKPRRAKASFQQPPQAHPIANTSQIEPRDAREPMGAASPFKHSGRWCLLRLSLSLRMSGLHARSFRASCSVRPKAGKGKRIAAHARLFKGSSVHPYPLKGKSTPRHYAVKSTCYAGAQARTGQRAAACSGVSMKGNGAPFPFSTKPEKAKAKGVCNERCD